MSTQPNIILITTDEQRYDALGINNPAIQTPFLDSLAAKGRNYTRAYTSCPLCIPARRTMLSGLHPTSHGLISFDDQGDFEAPDTIPAMLGRVGYQTQLIGKYHVGIPGKRYGFDNIIQSETPNDRRLTKSQRRNDYVDWLEQQGIYQHPLSSGQMSNDRTARSWHMEERFHHTNWVTQMGADYLSRKRDPDAPMYLHLSYWAPHQPLIPPQAYWDRYKDNNYKPFMGDWTNQDEWTAGKEPSSPVGPFRDIELQQAYAGYYGLINHIDDQLNYLFDQWSCSLLKNDRPTLILFSTDHGEMLGDHHFTRKTLPYEGSAHIPLFICGLNGFETPKGHSDQITGLEDMAATVLDAAGVERPAHFGKEDGVSLLSDHRRDALHGQALWCGQHIRYHIEEHYKYIRFSKTGEEQVFDMHNDLQELHDISGEISNDTLQRLRERENQHHANSAKANHYDGDAQLHPCNNQRPIALWGK